jgi:peptidoglycan/LPS O-acetylase OafA/YrhL
VGTVPVKHEARGCADTQAGRSWDTRVPAAMEKLKMSKPPGVAPPAVPPSSGLSARVASIDILRGLAILWVMVFHLWADMTLHLGTTPDLYPNFRDRVLDGRLLPALTSLGELILGQGYMGVALFMMLSGLSLTMNAYRRGEPSILRGYTARFRRILPVYWGGILLILGAVAAVALLQMLVDGGSYEHQWLNVRIAGVAPTNILWNDVAWALTVVPWVFRDKIDTVPVGSLWFVELLLQYYLIFPFALILLKKVGPWYFALAGIAIAVAARSAYIPWSRESIQPAHAVRYFELLSPFRVSEFFIGMSIGNLLACRRDQVAAWVKSPFDLGGLMVIGVMLVMGGVLLAPEGDTQLVASDVMVQVGLALLILPLLFKAPGRLEVSVLARALVFLGVISFTALIVNDMMRYFASFLRVEGVTGPPWWFFLWVVYIPVGTLLAYPLAKLFGLLPQQRARERAKASLHVATPPAPAHRRGAGQKRGPRASGQLRL